MRKEETQEAQEVSLDDKSNNLEETDNVEMSPVHDQIPRESQPQDTGDRLGNEHDTGSDRPLSTRPYSVSVNPKHPDHTRAKGAQQMSILGYGGNIGLSDITIPRILALLFFGGGELWIIPLFLVHIHSNNICCNFVHSSQYLYDRLCGHGDLQAFCANAYSCHSSIWLLPCT